MEAADASGPIYVRHLEAQPDFLAIGHVSRDLLPNGSWRLGGAVTYAALTATRLGLRAAIITSAPTDLLPALDAILPDIPISIAAAAEATTFENIYTSVGRQQFLRGRAALLTHDHVPAAWRDTRIVLLAPIAQEVDPSLATEFPHALVAAAPQGWLRQWDEEGLVSPAPLAHPKLLPQLRALILSREDVPPPSDTLMEAWAEKVPLVAVTAGSAGAHLWEHGVKSGLFASYPAREVDPTGAGDVFAAAFLCALHETGDAAEAVDFANRVAACSVEAPGSAGIPTREMLAARWNRPN